MRFDALERHARPVHPAAERIVERHAVDQHERPAHAARPDAAQRHALRRRMRRQTAAAPEQAERRHLPQHVVGHDRRRPPDRFLLDDVRAGRHVAEPLRAARRRDGDRLEQAGDRQHDFDSRLAGTDCVHSANPPARTTSVRSPAGGIASANRPSGPDTVCCSRPPDANHEDRRTRHHAAGFVPDDARDGGLGRLRAGHGDQATLRRDSSHDGEILARNPGCAHDRAY